MGSAAVEGRRGGEQSRMNSDNRFAHLNGTCCLVLALKEMSECITCRTISHRAARFAHKDERGGGVEGWGAGEKGAVLSQ